MPKTDIQPILQAATRPLFMLHFCQIGRDAESDSWAFSPEVTFRRIYDRKQQTEHFSIRINSLTEADDVHPKSQAQFLHMLAIAAGVPTITAKAA